MDDTVLVIGVVAIVGIAGVIGLLALIYMKSSTAPESSPLTIDYDPSGKPLRLREVK